MPEETEADRTRAALASVLSLERVRKLHPHELVIKGRLMQLQEATSFGLSDAEDTFKAALAIDKDFTPALLELGYFYFAVLDDPPRALPLFERAIEILREQLTEAIAGKVRCLGEAESPENAKAYLKAVSQAMFLVEKLDREHQEWLNER